MGRNTILGSWIRHTSRGKFRFIFNLLGSANALVILTRLRENPDHTGDDNGDLVRTCCSGSTNPIILPLWHAGIFSRPTLYQPYPILFYISRQGLHVWTFMNMLKIMSITCLQKPAGYVRLPIPTKATSPFLVSVRGAGTKSLSYWYASWSFFPIWHGTVFSDRYPVLV